MVAAGYSVTCVHTEKTSMLYHAEKRVHHHPINGSVGADEPPLFLLLELTPVSMSSSRPATRNRLCGVFYGWVPSSAAFWAFRVWDDMHDKTSWHSLSIETREGLECMTLRTAPSLRRTAVTSKVASRRGGCGNRNFECMFTSLQGRRITIPSHKKINKPVRLVYQSPVHWRTFSAHSREVPRLRSRCCRRGAGRRSYKLVLWEPAVSTPPSRKPPRPAKTHFGTPLSERAVLLPPTAHSWCLNHESWV